MAFDFLRMFGPDVANRLLQPSFTGPQNMLTAPMAPPLPSPVEVGAAPPVFDPMQTGAVTKPDISGFTYDNKGLREEPVVVPATNPLAGFTYDNQGLRQEPPTATAGGPPQMPQAVPKVPDKPGGLDKFTSDMFRENLNEFFLGMMMGKTPAESLAMGAFNANSKHNSMKNGNQTVAWLQSRGMDKEQAWQVAQNPAVLSEYLKQLINPTAKKGNFINAGGGAIYNADTGEWIVSPTGASRATEYGLNPIYGQDAEGNTVAYQLSKDGSIKQVEVPGGARLTPGISSTDLGTTVIVRDSRTGQVIDTREKDVAGAAREEKAGTAMGEARAALPAAEMTANMVGQQIMELKNDPYLPNMVGPINSRLPNITGDAARVQGRMNQIQGGAFLQARQLLKGGGAITDYEGAKAEDAYARLQTAQNYEDYVKALDDFNEAVQLGLRKLERQAGMQSGPQGGAEQGGRLRFNPATGELE